MRARERLTGWGRTAPTTAEIEPLHPHDVATTLKHASERGVIARGLGRSYGDAAQNAGGVVIDATAHNRFELDEATGTCTASAGASLDALMRALLPRGWFVPVTPGTRYVTVGGAIASDIHGKNHHAVGTFGAAVSRIELVTPWGEVRELTPEATPDEFWATVGGMGLTGVILSATFRMQPVETAQMVVDTERATDLDDCMRLLAEGDDVSPYSVAWIDCLAGGRSLGRSVITRGRHAAAGDVPSGPADARRFAPRTVAVAPPAPAGLLNRWTVRAFNELWYRKAPRRRQGEVQSLSTFFHPLDGVDGWNRLYGWRGFVQHQCVLPFGEEETLRRVIEEFSRARAAAFLAVLKRFGPANPAPLSFPIPGWTLALDIPAQPRLAETLDAIDELVAAAGGRVYLAKDSRCRPELLRQMYPRLSEWQAVQRTMDPDGVMASDLGRRLGLT